MPEEEVADALVGQGPLQQEGGEVTVQVGLVLQHLHQLDEVLQQLAVPGGGGREGARSVLWFGRENKGHLQGSPSLFIHSYIIPH